jgi:phage terminase small subunit
MANENADTSGLVKKATPKQIAFCEHYIACGNAAQAARLAGYSARNSAQQGLENLRKPYLAEYIARHSKTIAARSERILSAQERQELLSKIATDIDENTVDRIRAIDTLNKMTGAYTERVRAEVSHNTGVLDEILIQLRV